MSSLYLVIFMLILLLLFLRARKKDLADPLILHTVSWCLVFVIGSFNYDKFYPLNNFFWYHWILWFSGFLISYCIVQFIKKRKKNVVIYKSLPNYSKILYIITIAFFVLTVVQGLQGGYGNFLMNLRLSFIFKTNFLLQPFFFLFTFIWPLFLYEGLVFSNKKNIKALIFFLLVYTLASGGKFGILMTVSAVLLIFHQRKLIKKKHLVYVGVLSATAIIIMGIFREHNEDSAIGYIYAPSVAFQELQYESASIHFGHESLRFFYSAFKSLGLSEVAPPEDFYEYVNVPQMINVFTSMRPFYVDFGSYGVLIGGGLFGFFFTYCYRGYQNKELFGSVLYYGFAFAIVSAVFADLLFLNLSLVFRTILITSFLFIFNRKTF